MKIQKIVFSCSGPPDHNYDYSSYWNIQSRIYRGMGIEPVCIFYGKKDTCDMSEQYGQVIEATPIPGLPWAMQMTWSKFNHARSEPDTTWLIGDIDLVPVSRGWFTETIASMPDEHYLSLNVGGISIPRVGSIDGFLKLGSERHGKDRGDVGTDIPAHYHVAKGHHFNDLFFKGRTFEEFIRFIYEGDRYGMGVMMGEPKKNRVEQEYWYFWCSEENYTSEQLWNAIKEGRVNFQGFFYNNVHARIGPWDASRNDYTYDPEKVKRGEYVDIHCHQVRPYAKQQEALDRILSLAGLIKS